MSEHVDRSYRQMGRWVNWHVGVLETACGRVN